MDYEVIIIGAGPAGISAALQLQRHAIPALLIERDQVGGLLLNAGLVENYPGFPDGISGPKLVDLFKKQLEKHSISVMNAEITALDYRDGLFTAQLADRRLSARHIIIASGTKPRSIAAALRIPAELQNRIYREVYPLIGLKHKRVLIVGAGDAAFDYALSLAGENRVTIFNRGTAIRALPLLVRRAEANRNIEYRENTSISELFKSENGAAGVRFISGGKTEDLETDYLIFAIGREPRLDFLPESLMNIDNPSPAERNMHFIGDVKNGAMRQTAIAVGDGVRAAMTIAAQLKGEG